MMTSITNGWGRRKLGELFRVKHGYAFKGEFFSASGPYIVLTPGNFHEEGGFDPRAGKEKFYTGTIPHGYILSEDDIIVAMTEQAEGLLGSAAVVPASNLYLHNQRLGLITEISGKELDRKFLFYLFNTQSIRQQIRGTANGAKVRHTSPSRIYEVAVNLPPILSQRKIAAILSTYDDLIENNTRRIQILEEMAQALYREWFVNFRFPGHETSGMVESEVGPIPEGWRVTPFSKAANFVNGFAFAPHHWKEDGLPIIKIAELKNGVTDKTPRNPGDDVPAKFHIINGDVLFSWSADLDAYIWGHGVGLLNQHLFKVEPTDGITKVFLYFSLKDRMGEFRNRSNGATMKHIKRSALDEVCFAAPAPELVRRFSDNVNPIVEQTLNLASRNNCLRQTRDLLLPKLISGEVDVADLDIAMGETN